MIIVLIISFGLYYSRATLYSNDLGWVNEYVIGSDNVKGAVDIYQFGDNEAYKIGANKYGFAVFKNPNQAFEQMKKDYEEGIEAIKEEYKLNTLSKINFMDYANYGWQLPNKYSEEEINQARKVSAFLDIYENSFSQTTIFNKFFK